MACTNNTYGYECEYKDQEISAGAKILESEYGNDNHWIVTRKGYWIGYYDDPNNPRDGNLLEDPPEVCEDGGAGVDPYDDPRLTSNGDYSRELKVFYEGDVYKPGGAYVGTHVLIATVGYNSAGELIYGVSSKAWQSSHDDWFTTTPFDCHLCIEDDPNNGCNQHCKLDPGLGCDDCFTQHFIQ